MKTIEVVVDTNVAIVANGQTEQAGPKCRQTSIRKLHDIVNEYRLLLDYGNLIISEYRRHLHPSGQPGVGDYFFKWLFDNQANPEHCRKVAITLNETREFDEFPDDDCLASFDRADRKFVAVVLASGSSPKVQNASDTDWWHHLEELKKHGVEIDFLCPELMTLPRSQRAVAPNRNTRL